MRSEFRFVGKGPSAAAGYSSVFMVYGRKMQMGHCEFSSEFLWLVEGLSFFLLSAAEYGPSCTVQTREDLFTPYLGAKLANLDDRLFGNRKDQSSCLVLRSNSCIYCRYQLASESVDVRRSQKKFPAKSANAFIKSILPGEAPLGRKRSSCRALSLAGKRSIKPRQARVFLDSP